MVELRKRPAPPAAPPPAKKKAAAKPKATKEKAEAASSDAKMEDAAPASSGPPKAGQSITLEGFGGEVETNDEKKVTLAQLAEESRKGVVLFTYPKASTPGCMSIAA